MASNRPNNPTLQGRPLKPALASSRTAKTPLAPRLAAAHVISASQSVGTGTGTNAGAGAGANANANTHSHSNGHAPVNVNVNTNPAAAPGTTPNTFPRAAAVTPRVVNGTNTTTPLRSNAPALQPSPIEDTTALFKDVTTDHITPRTTTRKYKVDSASTTPLAAEDTPSHVRPKLMSPHHSEGNIKRVKVDEGRPHVAVAKARSIVSGKEAVRGPPASSRSPAYITASQHGPPKINKDTSPMFFRADQVKPQSQQPVAPDPQPPKRPVPKKTPSTFFYANSQSKPNSRNSSPDHSTAPLPKLPNLHVPHVAASSVVSTSSSGPRSPILSPPLSSLSSRSPFFPGPPALHPPSPPKESIHLSYRKGVSQIIGRTSSPAGPSHAVLDRPNLHLQGPRPRQSSLGQRISLDGQPKRSSLSSIDTSSPDEAHADWRAHNGMASTLPPTSHAHTHQPQLAHLVHQPHLIHLAHQAHLANQQLTAVDDGRRSRTNSETRSLLAPLEENEPSPDKQISDLAVEARRERKVLDLEISNSSLLAINKSLEREIRKQKAELKRFRRLSRAGQFNVAAGDGPAANHMSPLDEEGDGLPNIGPTTGRPSSPFDSEVGEGEYSDEDEDSTGSSNHPLSPTAQAAKDALHRADDEDRLQQDLNKHRELLLDTERTNKSLQRCLTWTEDLIKHGKKALEYQVPSVEVKLGGRILHDDDDDDDETDEGASTHDSTKVEEELLDIDRRVDQLMNDIPDPRWEHGFDSAHPDRHSGSDYGPSPANRHSAGGTFDPPRINRHSGSATGSGSEKDSGVEFGPFPQTPFRATHSLEFGKPTPLRNPLLMSRDNPGNSHSLRP